MRAKPPQAGIWPFSDAYVERSNSASCREVVCWFSFQLLSRVCVYDRSTVPTATALGALALVTTSLRRRDVPSCTTRSVAVPTCLPLRRASLAPPSPLCTAVPRLRCPESRTKAVKNASSEFRAQGQPQTDRLSEPKVPYSTFLLSRLPHLIPLLPSSIDIHHHLIRALHRATVSSDTFPYHLTATNSVHQVSTEQPFLISTDIRRDAAWSGRPPPHQKAQHSTDCCPRHARPHPARHYQSDRRRWRRTSTGTPTTTSPAMTRIVRTSAPAPVKAPSAPP